VFVSSPSFGHRVLVYYMHSTSPVSYEHPRRNRAFNSPADKGSPYRPDQLHFLDSRITRIEEAVARMESSLSKKFDSMTSRIDKCSELSVASSRAVAAVSSQLENFKNENLKGASSVNSAIKDLRATATKLCSDSQSETMRVLENLTSEMMKRIELNADSIDQIRQDQENLLYEQSKLLEVVEKELENVNLDISIMGQKLEETRNLSTTVPDNAIKEEIGTISEFICKSMLGDLEERLSNRCDGLSSQFQDTRFRTSERLDHISRVIEESESKFSNQVTDKVHAVESAVSELRRELIDQITAIRERVDNLPETSDLSIDPISLDPILAKINDVNKSISELTISTLPQFVKEIESGLISAEYKSEEKTVRLLQDLCVEFDSDISRLVELVHSVYVQGNLTMPPGTLTSWKKFKEVMFDDNGGRKPILGEAVLNHLAQPRAKNHASPGRLFSRS
jgi:hypothetical protein